MGKLNFTLTQLEYLMAVYQQGHFAKAAEICFVTQPTLSMQISKLEENLGVILLDRSKKPVRLTVEGEALLDLIQGLLNQAKRIESTLQGLKQGALSGELTVGLIPTVGPYLLPLIIKALEAELPQVEFRFYEMQTQEILEALKSESLDLGILAMPVEAPRLIQTPLYYEPFFIYCDKKHPLAQQKRIKATQLDTQDIWLLEEGHCLRTQILEVCHAVKSNTRAGGRLILESGSLEMIRNMIKTLGGYTLVPFLAAQNRDAGAVIKELSPPIPSRQIGLIHLRTHHKQAIIQRVHQVIHRVVPEELKKRNFKQLKVIPVHL